MRFDRGFVTRETVAGAGVRVAITAGGEKFLRRRHGALEVSRCRSMMPKPEAGYSAWRRNG